MVKIVGLGRFGLTARKLEALGDLPVSISIQQRGIPVSGLQRFRPKGRKKRQSEFLKDGLARLRRKWPEAKIKPRGRTMPWTLDAVVPAAEVSRIAKTYRVERVSLSKVKGIKERRAEWERPKLGWYCVWGAVAIQVEGVSKGMVTVEDRLVLLKAFDEQDATRRLRNEWRRYAAPYMNSAGQLVRWQFLKAIDVYRMWDSVINPKGTEVFSRLTRKRIRPEYAWRASG